MTSRRLNDRQRWRIDRIQQLRQERLQRRDTQGVAIEVDPNGEQQGLVIAHFGDLLSIASGEVVIPCRLRQNMPQIVVGDHVVWQENRNGEGVVTALLPRRSLLARPQGREALRPIAANLDQIAIVAAPTPTYSLELIDQYLAAAELSGIPAFIVLNKSDLIAAEADEVAALTTRYRAIGYPLIEVSTLTDHGIDSLQQQLQGGVAVFVGQSGVGKSSLVNRLIPGAATAVGPLSLRSGLGQHTTSTARLYPLDNGGGIIDSPGVRDFRLWAMDRATLALGFREFTPHLGGCRFRDCSHRHEPGCLLLAAVAAGTIAAQRLESFHKLAIQVTPPPHITPRSGR
jgi:ribosome biogenesis GTPase / thiamine phosphate phosphatase